MRRGPKPKWIMQTMECVLLTYREKKALLTGIDVRGCLSKKYGLKSTEVMDSNIDEARRLGLLYDLSSDKDMEKLEELGYGNLTRKHGRGRLVPTVLALIHWKVYSNIDEILRKIGVEDEGKDENVKLFMDVFPNKILKALNNILDTMSDSLRKIKSSELEELSAVRPEIEIIVPRSSLKFSLQPLERIRLVGFVEFIITAFRDSLNGKPHPILPSLIDYYEAFTNTLTDLLEYYLRQELELKKKIRNEIEELVKRKLSEGGYNIYSILFDT
jgi:hypothetical protein